MRFIVDESTGPVVAAWLQDEGHDVFSVYDEARGADDDDILKKAAKENRILITNDKDFGEMVFRKRHPHRGVIFLRLDDERTPNKIEVLSQLLKNHADRLPDRFVVVTDEVVRFAQHD